MKERDTHMKLKSSDRWTSLKTRTYPSGERVGKGVRGGVRMIFAYPFGGVRVAVVSYPRLTGAPLWHQKVSRRVPVNYEQEALDEPAGKPCAGGGYSAGRNRKRAIFACLSRPRRRQGSRR